MANYEALKTYIDEHYHLPPKNALLGAKYLLNKALCGVEHNAQLKTYIDEHHHSLAENIGSRHPL